MSMPLLKRNMKQMSKVLILFGVILAMYFGVVIYMFDPKLMETLTSYQELMPEMMAAVGMTGATSNLLEFINTYLYGFLMILFPFLYLLILGNQYLMKYKDSGSLACILATPNSRRKIILTQVVSLIFSLTVLMIVTTGMGLGFSEAMFPGELYVKRFLLLNVSMWLVQLVIAGIIFFAACFFQESKQFYLVGCGLPLIFYLFQMLGNMGDKFDWLKYFTIYTLFPADDIVAGNLGAVGNNLILLGMAIVLFSLGIKIFESKDLYV